MLIGLTNRNHLSSFSETESALSSSSFHFNRNERNGSDTSDTLPNGLSGLGCSNVSHVKLKSNFSSDVIFKRTFLGKGVLTAHYFEESQ